MKLFFAILIVLGSCGCSHVDSNGCLHLGGNHVSPFKVGHYAESPDENMNSFNP